MPLKYDLYSAPLKTALLLHLTPWNEQSLWKFSGLTPPLKNDKQHGAKVRTVGTLGTHHSW